MEKSLPYSTEQQQVQPAPRRWPRLLALSVLGCLAIGGWLRHPNAQPVMPIPHGSNSIVHADARAKCYQAPALFPAKDDELERMFEFLSTSTFENSSIARLSGAVQIPTESFDDLGVIGEDKRWDVFYNLFNYFKTTFPHVHEALELEKVNTHGLLYTWKGSNDKLKPLVLMAHQDVVPVEGKTVDSWTHPPWSGYFDGKRIWGRGSSDCKNSLIGIMEVVELLLDAGFKPQRTIILSFGFDEECSGNQGAASLAARLEELYGDDGVAAVVDEGAGYVEMFGRGFAAPGVAEKGHTDVSITVRTSGGHSSIPPDHTSIGILSELITAIEANKYKTYLDEKNPVLSLLHCAEAHAPKFPKELKKLLHEHSQPKTCKAKPDKLANAVAKFSREARYLMETSQAVDIIQGGVKANALPETAEALVNHRINIGDTPETVYHHLSHLARPIAKKYNLTLHAFDGEKEAYNSISLSAIDTLRVAPVTPSDASIVSPYAVLAGTTRAVFGEDIIVTPLMMTGNTDTQRYWNLTQHIFRYAPGNVGTRDPTLGKIHTVDESVEVKNHFELVKWYTMFIRNMDEAELEA